MPWLALMTHYRVGPWQLQLKGKQHMGKHLENYDYIFAFGLIIMSSLIVKSSFSIHFAHSVFLLALFFSVVVSGTLFFSARGFILSKFFQTLFILASSFRLGNSFCFSRIFTDWFVAETKAFQTFSQSILNMDILVFAGVILLCFSLGLVLKKDHWLGSNPNCLAARFIVFENLTHFILVIFNFSIVIVSTMLLGYKSLSLLSFLLVAAFLMFAPFFVATASFYFGLKNH